MGRYRDWKASLTPEEIQAAIDQYGPAPANCNAVALEAWAKGPMRRAAEAEREEQQQAVARLAVGRPQPGDQERALAFAFGGNGQPTPRSPAPQNSFFMRAMASAQTACAAPSAPAPARQPSPAASGQLWQSSPDHGPRLTSREALLMNQADFATLRAAIFEEYAVHAREKAEAREKAAAADKLDSGGLIDIKRDGTGNITGTREHQPNIGPNSLPLRVDGSSAPLPFHVSREVPSA